MIERKKINMSMNFGEAIQALKTGKKVARCGWNGKGMFAYYVPANSYPVTVQKKRLEIWLPMLRTLQ